MENPMPVNLLATPAAELFPVPGVRWGIAEAGIRKAGRKDLSVLLLDEGCVVSGVFTQNRFCAAPVQICREHLGLHDGGCRWFDARARQLHSAGTATQCIA